MKLRDFDLILVNTSGGKDSQVSLDVVARQAEAEGVLDRVHAVHADLGRCEWAGTRELAEEQAAHYGIPFHVMKRPQGDLLEHVEARGKWPSSTARYCTSDHKRGQCAKVVTRLVKEWAGGRRCQVLNVFGFRAEESSARAKRQVVEENKRLTNSKRQVIDWLPIHEWTETQVWNHIRQTGVRHHAAYDHGMPRLSCVFCVFAPRAALLIAGKHNPDLLAEYCRVEEKIDHTFRKDFSIREIRDALAGGEAGEISADDAAGWNM